MMGINRQIFADVIVYIFHYLAYDERPFIPTKFKS